MKGWGFLVAVVLAGYAHAQSPGEISFWESVRDSKDPAELRAYLQRYPDGAFKPLAESRLRALEKSPAAQARPAPAQVASTSTIGSKSLTPQVGDTWTYRLTQPRLRGRWGQPVLPPATHTIRASAVSASEVIEQLSIDGSSPIEVRHTRESYLLPEGVSIYSPYLLAFNPGAAGKLASIVIRDAPCSASYACEASGRVVGQERVSVAAGQFLATKVVIEQSWRPRAISGLQGGQLIGGRTLTIWYAPEIRRAVKYSSRPTVGDTPPVEPNFDLELVSYNLQ